MNPKAAVFPAALEAPPVVVVQADRVAVAGAVPEVREGPAADSDRVTSWQAGLWPPWIPTRTAA